MCEEGEIGGWIGVESSLKGSSVQEKGACKTSFSAADGRPSVHQVVLTKPADPIILEEFGIAAARARCQLRCYRELCKGPLNDCEQVRELDRFSDSDPLMPGKRRCSGALLADARDDHDGKFRMKIAHPGCKTHGVDAQRLYIDNPKIDVTSVQELLFGPIGA